MKKVPLEKIATISAGQGAPKQNEFSGNGIPFVRAGSLEDLILGKKETDLELVPVETTKKRKLKLYPKGSILFAKSGMSATKDRIYVLKNSAHVVSHLAILKPKKNTHTEYLKHVLIQFPPSILIKDPAYPSISLDEIRGYNIPVPEEFEDQKRIAHLLGKVEGLISRRKQHLQQLDDLLKSVFLEMFGNPVRNENGWRIESLGDLANIERGRFSPRPRNDPKYYGGLYPFIQTGDISRSDGRLRDYTQTLNEFGIKVSKEFKVGTIVIAIVGATIGETAILEIPTYAPDSVIGITPKKGKKETESVFIEFVLRFWKPVLRDRAPEAARANINIQTLRPLPIIWPQNENRKKFAIIVAKIEGIKSRYQQSLTDLEHLYGALSQKAFKGELDLSRIPLPTEKLPISQEEKTEPEAKPPEKTPFELPTPADFSVLQSLKGRKALLDQWVSVWFKQSQAIFTAQDFMETARQRLWDLAEDEIPDWGAAEYDELKAWVFKALEQGGLTQTYDDADNRVQLNAAKG
nr:restriction endonuclease subunit S [uncultured Desulfobacter sp.]